MCHAMRATPHQERDLAISLDFGVTFAVTTLSHIAIFSNYGSVDAQERRFCWVLNFPSLFILFCFIFVVTVEVVKEEEEEEDDDEDDENDKEEKDQDNSKSDPSEHEEL